MLYHLLGSLNSLIFLLTWYGLARQLIEMNLRRRQRATATQNLSLNQFGSSFFAFYANFIFGIAVEPFNHYLVWTRCGALLLLIGILFWIWAERRTVFSTVVTVMSCLAFLGGLLSMMFRPYPGFARIGSNTLMLIVTVLLVQGTIHQWLLIRRRNDVGALSFSLIRSIVLKDLSTLAFAMTMPIAQAWPLLLLNGNSALTRGALLYQMRRVGTGSRSKKKA